MTYAAKQDLIDRFGEEVLVQLTDRDGSAGAIVDDVLTRALEDADAEINSYLSGHYTLPLAEAPDVLVRIAAIIARSNLYADGAPDYVVDERKQAVAFLRDVANGKARLGDQDAPGDAPSDGGGVHYAAPDRVFNDDTLKGF